jgi:hypothetical protein
MYVYNCVPEDARLNAIGIGRYQLQMTVLVTA